MKAGISLQEHMDLAHTTFIERENKAHVQYVNSTLKKNAYLTNLFLRQHLIL